MKTCNRGIVFHAHHDTLVEWCPDYDERVEKIKETKAKEEQALRLRLFKLIPADRLPSELTIPLETYTKAWEAYDKARQARQEALEARDRAWQAREKARETYDRTWEACSPLFERLHEELCPDCP